VIFRDISVIKVLESLGHEIKMAIGFNTDISCWSTMYSRGQNGKLASK